MGCETCKGHTDPVKDAAEAGRLMADMVQAYDRQNRRLWAVVLALVAALLVPAGCMIWAVNNAQKITNEAVLEALCTVSEMEVVSETTTTTEITQDTGKGSGNNVYLDGDSTTYNEAAGE